MAVVAVAFIETCCTAITPPPVRVIATHKLHHHYLRCSPSPSTRKCLHQHHRCCQTYNWWKKNRGRGSSGGCWVRGGRCTNMGVSNQQFMVRKLPSWSRQWKILAEVVLVEVAAVKKLG